MLYFLDYIKAIIYGTYKNALRVNNFMNHWAKWYFIKGFKNIDYFKFILCSQSCLYFTLLNVIIYYDFFIAEYSIWYKIYHSLTLVILSYLDIFMSFVGYYYNELFSTVCVNGVKFMEYIINKLNFYSYLYGPFLNILFNEVYAEVLDLVYYISIVVKFFYKCLNTKFTVIVIVDGKNIISLCLWLLVLLMLIAKYLYIRYSIKDLKDYVLSLDFHMTLLFLWFIW